MMDLVGLAEAMAIAGVMVEHSRYEAMTEVCELLENSAKNAIGTYEFGWTPLKPETIARKTTGDSPLLETGQLQSSITHNVDSDGKEAYVGSDDRVAVWQEFGTGTIPPRPYLGGALYAEGHKIAEIVGHRAFTALVKK